MEFKGFNEKAPEFLRDIYINNSKQWYESHKEQYEKLIKQPFYDLAEDLTPTVRTIDPEIMTDPKRCLSRIFRDARYIKDGMKYRSSAWLTFRRPVEELTYYPAFFAELTSEFCRYGMGAYDMKPKAMALLRAFISENTSEFRKIIAPIAENEGLFIEGEYYKKIPAGAPEGLEKWFSLRTFYMTSGNLPCEKMYESNAAEAIINAFLALAPLYTLLSDIEKKLAANDYSKRLTALNGLN